MFALLTTTFLVHAASPALPYWHVHVDAEGRTHQVRCTIEGLTLKPVAEGVQPQWLKQLPGEVAKVSVTTQPVGWVGDWHENPGPQWIIPLAGRWFVETQDGTRVEMGPGEVSFGEDQGSRANGRGHRGHLSGTVGNAPATLLIVSLKTKPAVGLPCHVR